MPHNPGVSSALLFISKDFLEVFLVPYASPFLAALNTYLSTHLPSDHPIMSYFLLLCSGGSNFSFSLSSKKIFHILNPMYLLINVKFRFPADSEMNPPNLAESHLVCMFPAAKKMVKFYFREFES